MKRIGWGTFNVPITINFKKETGIREPVKIDYELSFKGTGSIKFFTLTFEKEILDKLNKQS